VSGAWRQHHGEQSDPDAPARTRWGSEHHEPGGVGSKRFGEVHHRVLYWSVQVHSNVGNGNARTDRDT
jgi:hypothetical protein